jgi:hypothetical protein
VPMDFARAPQDADVFVPRPEGAARCGRNRPAEGRGVDPDRAAETRRQEHLLLPQPQYGVGPLCHLGMGHRRIKGGPRACQRRSKTDPVAT